MVCTIGGVYDLVEMEGREKQQEKRDGKLRKEIERKESDKTVTGT